MAYKMITISEREVGRVAGFAGAWADFMARNLTARWRKQLPKGQKVIDIRQVQLCVQADLEDLRREISQIERDHLARLTDDKLSRDVRDGTIPQLRAHLIGIKSLFDGGYGAGTSIDSKGGEGDVERAA